MALHLFCCSSLTCLFGLQTVLDALRARKERFVFEDIEVTLRPTVMAFITMNPGYPGRAELPESLKVIYNCFHMHYLLTASRQTVCLQGWAVALSQLYICCTEEHVPALYHSLQ